MAIVQVSLGNTFEEWRQITNAALTAAGDMSTLYDVTKTDVVQALNDLNTRKLNLAGGTMTGALVVLDAVASNQPMAKGQVDTMVGSLASLNTVTKTNIVAALNEAKATAADDAFINALLFGG